MNIFELVANPIDYSDSDNEKSKLGKAIDAFLNADHSEWPPSLQRFYKDLPSSKKPENKLLLPDLIDWMSEETGLDSLASPKYKKKYSKLMHQYKAAIDDPGVSASTPFLLVTALARCGVVKNSAGEPIKDPVVLAKMLYEE